MCIAMEVVISRTLIPQYSGREIGVFGETAMFLFITILLFFQAVPTLNNEINTDYWTLRKHVLNLETSNCLGGKITLNDKEIQVNEILLKLKLSEISNAFNNISNFPPANHFFLSKQIVEKSKVFEIIKMLPKGASLHSHTIASGASKYIYDDITYRKNLYGCIVNGNLKLKFFEEISSNSSCQWELLNDLRNKNDSMKQWINNQLTLVRDNPKYEYPNIHVVWNKFRDVFRTTFNMFAYRPVFEDYIYEVLRELHQDNVMYIEFRGTFMPLYELNGTTYGPKEFIDSIINVVNRFKRSYPDFIGVRYIYAFPKIFNNSVAQENFETLRLMTALYPEFIAGLDLIGFEDEEKPLIYFINELQDIRSDINFYFHAGETNWYGTQVDLNLLDAVLLGTKRIGHGYALVKHPEILKHVREADIAIEISPISNQVLMLVEDLRNHPAVELVANGYPVVVCNDDPSMWGAKGLSYDWYLFFMGMSRKNAGLELLKQLAINSLTYSSMTASEKSIALRKWEIKWDLFLNKILDDKLLSNNN